MAGRRPLLGDPANHQTRRRASGDDPRKGPQKFTGTPDLDLPPSYVGLRIPCPICIGTVWSHQIEQLQTGKELRGAPAQPFRDREMHPTIGRRWAKNIHTGTRGAYWEWEPATARHAVNAYAWIAARMRGWLEANNANADSSDSQAWRERDEAQEMYERVNRDNEQLLSELGQAHAKIQRVDAKLQLLEAEYARLRKTAEPAPHRARAAANPPPTVASVEIPVAPYLPVAPPPLAAVASVDLPVAPRWRAASELNEHACVLKHWMARNDLEPYRKAVDASRERQGANPSYNLQSILSYDLKDYARRLPKLIPTEPCAKPCCEDLSVVKAEISAVESELAVSARQHAALRG